MVIIVKMVAPTESAKEVLKRSAESSGLPAYITVRGPYVTNTMEGASGLTVYEMEMDKLAEGYQVIGSSMAKYFGIPGFRCELKLYKEMRDPMPPELKV